MMKKQILPILILALLLPGGQAHASKISELFCKTVFGANSKEMHNFPQKVKVETLLSPVKHLPSGEENFKNTYHSFKTARQEKYFSMRLKAAFKKSELKKPSSSQLLQMKEITEEKNELFLIHYGKKMENSQILSFESSHLKELNDLDKEMATSLNHFAKLNFIVTIFEEAAASPKMMKLFSEQLLSEYSPKTGTLGIRKQSDFKTLRLALDYETPKERLAIQRVLAKAYSRSQHDLLFILQTNYPRFYQRLQQELPLHIKPHRLFRAMLADNLIDSLMGIKQIKKMNDDVLRHYSRGRKNIKRLVTRRVRNFFRLWNMVGSILSKPTKLIEIDSVTGVPFPSPEFFMLMKIIAPEKRTRNASLSQKTKDDYAYFLSIKKHLQDLYRINISLIEVRALVKFYHAATAVVPSFAGVRLDPLIASVDKTSFIISADRVNASGLEASLVAKHLLRAHHKSGGKDPSEVKNMDKVPLLGVNETTKELSVWSERLSKFFWEVAFPHIEIEAKNSGDDGNYRFTNRQPPTIKELKDFAKAANRAEYVELMEQSRITMAEYKPNELVQERVGVLESIQKDIVLLYLKDYKNHLHKLPRFSVIRSIDDNTKVKLILLEEATPKQIELLKTLINSEKLELPYETEILEEIKLSAAG